jgi:hypothetical protein
MIRQWTGNFQDCKIKTSLGVASLMIRQWTGNFQDCKIKTSLGVHQIFTSYLCYDALISYWIIKPRVAKE